MTVVSVTVIDGLWVEYLEDVQAGDWICHRLAAEQLDVPDGRVRADCGRMLPAWRCTEMPDITLPGSRSTPWCDDCCRLEELR